MSLQKYIGNINPKCNTCPEGYFCPEGTAIPIKCGGDHVYCAFGSSSPTLVPPGYKSLGGGTFTRSSITSCYVGHYCINGVEFTCFKGL